MQHGTDSYPSLLHCAGSKERILMPHKVRKLFADLLALLLQFGVCGVRHGLLVGVVCVSVCLLCLLADKTVESLETKRNAEDAQEGLVTMDTVSRSDGAMRRGRRGSHDGIVTMDTIPHTDGITMDTIPHRDGLADEK